MRWNFAWEFHPRGEFPRVWDRHEILKLPVWFQYSGDKKNAKMAEKRAGEDKILIKMGADCTFIIFTEYVPWGI